MGRKRDFNWTARLGEESVHIMVDGGPIGSRPIY